jgi:hypothetical protein
VSDETLADESLILVFSGKWHALWMLRQVFAAIDEAACKAQSRKAAGKVPERSDISADHMTTLMETFCEIGRHKLPKTNFVLEDLPTTNRIYAFKRDQLRVYGAFVEPSDHPRTFLCTAIDPGKKRNQPNKAIIARADRLMSDHLDLIRARLVPSDMQE